MSTTTLEVPQEQADRIKELAQNNHMTVSAVLNVMVELTSAAIAAVGAREAISVGDMIEALQRLTPQAAYTSAQFMSDLAEANSNGDVVAAAAARARARAASIGFNSAAGRNLPDGVAYQNDMRDTW